MSKQDAYREAKAKLDKTEQRKKKLDFIRKRKQKEFELQRMAIFASIRKAGVYDVDRCLVWAFGPDAGIIGMNYWMERWNTYHSNIFKIWKEDGLEDTFERIGKAYMKYCIEPAYAKAKELGYVS